MSMENYHWSTQDYIYVTAECLTGIFSLLDNALVLIAIARTPSLQIITNCFIGSLAVSDLLVGIVIPPTVILPYRGLPRDFHGCVLINTVVVLITNISILSLLGVAWERFLAISDPYRYCRVMSVKRAMLVVTVTWITAILIGLIPTMGWNMGEEGFEECSFTKVIDMRYMVFLAFFVVTLVPLLSMLGMYLYIFHIIRKQQRTVVQLASVSGQETQSVRKQKREVWGAKGLAYVIVLFAVCWMPIHLLNCVTLFAPEKKVSQQWHLVAIVLSHTNSFINPFLYAFSNSKFKKAILQFLFCGHCKNCYDTDNDRRYPIEYRTTTYKPPKCWSSLGISNVLPSSASQLQVFVEPRKSIRSSAIFNHTFSAEELGSIDKENSQAVSDQPQSDEALVTQTEPKAKVTGTKTKQIRYNSEGSDDRQSVHHQGGEKRVLVAGANDGTPTAENGPNTQVRATRLAWAPPNQNQVVPDSEHPQNSKQSNEPHTEDCESSLHPHSQCSNNNHIIHSEPYEDAKVEIQDSKSGSMHFPSIQL